MSDLARLRADIARTLGVEQIPSLELGGAAGVDGERIAELAGAPAALVSVRNRALDPGSDGWTAEELIEAVEATGRTAGWLGISDAHGSLGRRAGLTCLIEDAGGKATAALAGGALGLGFDWVLDDASPTAKPRVLIASYEFVGPTRTGGIGTAYTSLAETLAAAGHEVTVLFSGWDEPGGEPLAHWADHYRKLGISLHGLPTETSPCAETGHRHADRAHQVYRWLRERERSGERFDVVHFPEVLGHGFYAIGAKRQGLAFAQTTFAIGTHSSTSWVLETNRTLCQAPDDFADEFIERRCVESTDTLISPSAYMLDWMRARGWTLPARHFVQQYARSQAVDALAAAAPAATPQAAGAAAPTEIVFFGRLEPRKGLVVFCDALDRLSERPELPPWRATFLGKHSEIDGVPAGAYVRERAALWSGEVELIDGMNQPQAVGYLRSGGRRVTVIPSLADNSPNTVYEALALEIPFIASRVGGTAELIDPRDLARSTFDPGEGGAVELARRLEGALAAEQLDAPRPSVAAGVCRDAHVTWHVRVAASAPPPVEPPEPPPLSVQIVGDDPAAIRRTRDSLAGAAASEIGTAATHAEAGSSAATILFVDAGIELLPGAAATLAAAAASSAADVVAGAVEFEHAGATITRVAVGGPASAGLVRRCFGDSAFLIRAETLEALGGFDARIEPRFQAHVLLCRAAIAGRSIEPLPDAIGRAAESTLRPLSVAVASKRIPGLIEAYREAPPALLRELPLLLQQSWASVAEREAAYIGLYRDRFGPLTMPVRYLVHKVRRLQALIDHLRRRSRP